MKVQRSSWIHPSVSRKNFKNRERVIFIAATDALAWLKGEISEQDGDFSADNIFFSTDLFSSIGVEAPGPGEDLALLSLCNLSIISVGCDYLWTGLKGRGAGKIIILEICSKPFDRQAHLVSGEPCLLEARLSKLDNVVLIHIIIAQMVHKSQR